MPAQTTYSWKTQYGAAGGIVDLVPYAIDTRLNEENTGALKFGVGVVTGTHAGSQVKLPTNSSTAAAFEGIVTNDRTTEYDLEGRIYIRNKAALGVMRYGRVYARVATGATPAYGDPLYMVLTGDEAGYFTDSSSSTLAIKGRFLSAVDGTSGIAMVELFNQAQVEGALASLTLGDLADVDTTGVADGKVLKYVGSATKWEPGTDET